MSGPSRRKSASAWPADSIGTRALVQPSASAVPAVSIAVTAAALSKWRMRRTPSPESLITAYPVCSFRWNSAR